jgi:hypothetical protein
MILTENRDYFPKQHWPDDLCNNDVLCFLWGTDGILEYLGEFRLQRVNYGNDIAVSLGSYVKGYEIEHVTN